MANSVQIATLFKTEEIFLRTLIFYVLSTLITFSGVLFTVGNGLSRDKWNC